MSSEPVASAETTPPTSPETRDNGLTEAMQKEEEQMAKAREREDAKHERKLAAERKKDMKEGSGALETKYKALEYLLSQSKLYSTIMLQQMTQQEDAETAKDEKSKQRAVKREEKAEQAAVASQKRSTRRGAAADQAEEADTKELPKRGRGRPPKNAKTGKSGKISDYLKKEDLEAKAGQASISEALAEESKGEVKASDIGMQNLRSAKQPELVTGGLMRTYQLEGLEWLQSLYENGLNGILADEMGLGKTVQTISFIAFLREKGINGPFLIAAPLSTTSNWVAEFKKWTPDIPVVLYHGSKQEREEIRTKRLRNPSSKNFPVICTSYEICMNDRKHLSHFGWKFIIIDEGHRIKNMNCKLIRELQSYQSANRLLITGTPLQNNLAELWALLHFLMPSIFNNYESFESWFDFSALKEKGGAEQLLSEERQKTLVTSLHAVLKPFLLRRIKADVETSLPKKREYVLYAPLTQTQRDLYQEILDGNSRAFLENKLVESISRAGTPGSTRSSSRKRKAPSEAATPSKSTKTSRASTPATTGTTGPRSRKAKKNQQYEELSDTKYFQQLEDEPESPMSEEEEEDEEEAERSKTLALAKREIAQKKLLNPVMQLRQCCNSPHNFYYPFDLDDNTPVDETLVTESGKMLLLDRLLPELLKKGHKVLIFSQFKTQLDLLETYCDELRHWPTCRIDGSIAQTDRQAQIQSFNEPDSDTRIFLLSTRAGGQGINLAAADTVLLFDSDWNPQQDLQAQDRAHRIGQTRPVIVYRFATKGTVEQMLLEKADSKRRLEKLVISKGRFKSMRGDGGGADFAELQRLLGQADGETIDIAEGKKLLSDEDLAILTDRSVEAFERAEKGLDVVGDAFKAVQTKKDGEGGLLESLQK